MLAIGCLLPFLLLLAGGAIGMAMGGTAALLWGAAMGFVIGSAILVILLWGFERLKNR